MKKLEKLQEEKALSKKTKIPEDIDPVSEEDPVKRKHWYER